MVTVWLLPAGLILYALGAFLQIAEEWRQRGLTDTSYRSLICLVAGPTLVAIWALSLQHWAIAAITYIPGLLAAVLLGLKVRDLLRTKLRW